MELFSHQIYSYTNQIIFSVRPRQEIKSTFAISYFHSTRSMIYDTTICPLVFYVDLLEFWVLSNEIINSSIFHVNPPTDFF